MLEGLCCMSFNTIKKRIPVEILLKRVAGESGRMDGADERLIEKKREKFCGCQEGNSLQSN